MKFYHAFGKVHFKIYQTDSIFAGHFQSTATKSNSAFPDRNQTKTYIYHETAVQRLWNIVVHVEVFQQL